MNDEKNQVVPTTVTGTLSIHINSLDNALLLEKNRLERQVETLTNTINENMKLRKIIEERDITIKSLEDKNVELKKEIERLKEKQKIYDNLKAMDEIHMNDTQHILNLYF